MGTVTAPLTAEDHQIIASSLHHGIIYWFVIYARMASVQQQNSNIRCSPSHRVTNTVIIAPEHNMWTEVANTGGHFRHQDIWYSYNNVATKANKQLAMTHIMPCLINTHSNWAIWHKLEDLSNSHLFGTRCTDHPNQSECHIQKCKRHVHTIRVVLYKTLVVLLKNMLFQR